MALKTANGGARGDKFKFEEEGDKLEGYYLGSSIIVINGDNVTAHNVQTDKGIMSPLGSTDLNRKLGEVPAGARVVIVFEGIKKLGKGKTLKIFDVKYDDEDVIAPPQTTASKAAATLAGAQLKG